MGTETLRVHERSYVYRWARNWLGPVA